MERLEQLRLIPKAERSRAEQLELGRLATRKSRTGNKVKDSKIDRNARAADTVEEFWQLNRRDVAEDLLAGWLALQEEVHDQNYWLQFGRQLPPEDEFYVSLEDGLEDLSEFIAEHAFIKDWVNFNSDYLNDFRPCWAIWETRHHNDRIWGEVEPYWKNPKLLNALIEENDPTRVYALYGVRIGMSEGEVTKWKRNHKPKYGEEN